MTIDKQIKGLEYLKKCGVFPFSDTRTGIVFDDECIDATLNTMHKYQKIADIIDNRYGKPVFKTLDEVIKVIENGNDD